MTSFDDWFAALAGGRTTAHRWQGEFATDPVPRSRLIRIPTGMGKTLGILSAWSWHRIANGDDRWPRRLVWCLPMRVLVEQTESVVREALGNVERLWCGRGAHAGKVGVHVLMGGIDPGNDWNLYPEECAVLIGTQDMLLSRALNRGYASGRARWPLEFGLLSHDALWVLDEVQLMDVGLATSAQVQAFHDDDAPRGFRPRCSWWMSATLQPDWLRSVDTAPQHAEWTREPCRIDAASRGEGLGSISKALRTTDIAAADARGFAQLCLEAHASLAPGAYGRITLIVCNTVERACATFDALRTLDGRTAMELVHSRFRPTERREWRARFLSREQCAAETERIIVATQVVEAGVDISASAVISELAPWSSLVQRFGRCARYGGRGTVIVVDRGREEGPAKPYDVQQLDAAWRALAAIQDAGADVGIAPLDAFEESLSEGGRRDLYPYEPRHLLLRRELVELFDTTPDLSGADLDVSRFIRSGEERDLQVFWLAVPKHRKGAAPARPPRARQPGREELCAVPFLRAREWLCGPETKTARKPRLKDRMRAWVWDWLDGDWVVAERAMLTPGRIVCVAADCGGYRVDRGFDPDSITAVPPVPEVALPVESQAQDVADASDDAEALSAAPWKTIACHGREAAEEAAAIARAVGLLPRLGELLTLAGRWHDLGKAHAAFQGAIRLEGRPDRPDLAKAPAAAWLKPPGSYRTADNRESRPGLRHELASMLALFAVLQRCDPQHPALLGPWGEALALLGHSGPTAAPAEPSAVERDILACTAEEFDLLAYLVLCHHGKVRVALHASPKDQTYRDSGDGRGLPIRGVRDGDDLPSVLLEEGRPPLPRLVLSLEPAAMGLSHVTGRSWGERTSGLLEHFGPGALAWLEALLIAADRRASRLTTTDPLLLPRTEP